jgi:hypothetical protein
VPRLHFHVAIMATAGRQFFSGPASGQKLKRYYGLFSPRRQKQNKKSLVFPTGCRVEDEGPFSALPLHLLMTQPSLPYQEKFRIRFFLTVENRTLLTLAFSMLLAEEKM